MMSPSEEKMDADADPDLRFYEGKGSTCEIQFGMRIDACFEQAVPSSSTSYNVTFLWTETGQTKSLLSEPVCLKGKLSLPLFDFISPSDISQLILF
ncbi:hypothetical protein AVEN_4246-1 [Araneus ventricosus]|uniref:Uncharacterized protein n=1 Tax=Araneus ventricosus TaxID=182803 RepID=A0A4Y2U8E9_ARAVE|nr:hypothetical protein AVEN_95795-1 [Araneus ventricosus]GBO08783.1 hypothetical protein AVEN_4246-1 [Araneus ventricosus]